MCGIFAIISSNEVKSTACFDGLSDMQHRGRESFGVSWIHNDKIESKKSKGEVINLLPDTVSKSWLGHVRYSTSGDTSSTKTQPILEKSAKWALAHNGNIPKIQVVPNLTFDPTHSDTQKLASTIEHLSETMPLEVVLETIVLTIDLAFSVVLQTQDGMYLLRDRFGLRPLGYIRSSGTITVASENWAMPGDFIDVKPGEIVFVGNNLEVRTIFQRKAERVAHCVFEYIYFLRGRSSVDGVNANNFRMSLGKVLGDQISSKTLVKGWQTSGAIICGVPTSGIYFGKAIGETLKLRYSQFLTKRADYPYRTFILKNPSDRLEACKKKFQVESDLIKDKVIILVDDSVVRGTTLKFLVKFLKLYEPKEVHFISGSPPVKHACYYGMDFPDIEDLVANKMNKEDLAQDLEISSLTYLDVSELKNIYSRVGHSGIMCDACFSGNYLK